MNYIVPEFEAVDEYYLIPELHDKSTMGGNEDLMELLWHNGQVVMQSQSQSQRSKKSETTAAAENDIKSSIIEDESGPSYLFMQEDEMASWLHYPVDDNNNTLMDCYLSDNNNKDNDIIYPTPVSSTPVVAAAVDASSTPPPPPFVKMPSLKRPVPPYKHVERELGQPKLTKFGHFSRPGQRRSLKPGQTSLSKVASTSKAVTNVVTPAVEAPESRGSCQNLAVEQNQKPSEAADEDVEFVYPDEKKQSHGGSNSTKRSRASEIHNLSERKRRDRINDKMKALQDLIPRCNKSDKASMLDDAIEYLKSLQMQVQMMSMGCGMVPMMFPGVQQYMPQMAMGMGMGLNHTMVPYPTNPTAMAAAAHLGQQFPVAGPTSQTANMSAPMMTSFPLSTQNEPRVPSFADPFQQYVGLQQSQQVHLNQGLGGMPPKASSINKDAPNPDIHQTG